MLVDTYMKKELIPTVIQNLILMLSNQLNKLIRKYHSRAYNFYIVNSFKGGYIFLRTTVGIRILSAVMRKL